MQSLRQNLLLTQLTKPPAELVLDFTKLKNVTIEKIEDIISVIPIFASSSAE